MYDLQELEAEIFRMSGINADDWTSIARRVVDRERALRAVLREREEELIELKGPCRTPGCSLHHAHRGPCDIEESR